MRFNLIFLLLTCSDAYKILVYNMKYAYSFSNFNGGLADVLVDAGHNVTSLIPLIVPTTPDGTVKSRVIHVPQSDATARSLKEYPPGNRDFWEQSPADLSAALATRSLLQGLFCTQCEATINHPGLLEQLKAEKFDVLITENFDGCGMGLAYAISPKCTILVSSTTLFDNVAYDVGVPVMPSINPAFTTFDLDIQSFWSRAKNVYRTYLSNVMYDPVLECTNDVYRKKYGDEFPGIRELTGQAAFVFTNSEPLIDFARPLLRKVVDIGGIFLKTPKKLDKQWDRVLGLRNKTVLISFGSIAKSVNMNTARKQAMLEAIARFPNVTFIWKYEALKDEFATNHAAKIDNLVLSDWTPQHDLLSDGRITAFVSHSGTASCQEMAARGVPGLFIPLFADHPRNAATMVHAGIGIALDKVDAANADKLADGIRRLLETESLYTNSKRMAAMLAARPIAPRDLFVKHVEFAAQFGPVDALHSRALQLGWIQYFLVDIIAITVVIGLLLSYSTYRILAYIVHRPFFNSKKTKQA